MWWGLFSNIQHIIYMGKITLSQKLLFIMILKIIISVVYVYGETQNNYNQWLSMQLQLILFGKLWWDKLKFPQMMQWSENNLVIHTWIITQQVISEVSVACIHFHSQWVAIYSQSDSMFNAIVNYIIEICTWMFIYILFLLFQCV